MSRVSSESIIQDTNQLISAMLEVVLPDFMAITKVLKEMSSSSSNFTDESRRAYQEIVKEIQYYDILTQKMQHIITLHQLILTPGAQGVSSSHSDLDATNVIRLNHLQFQVACFEYITSVNFIQENLRIMQKSLDVPLESHAAFPACGIFLSASRNINLQFTKLAKINDDLDVNVLSRIEMITSIYSMESERAVLNAYMRKPSMTDAEIEPVENRNQTSDIDLF